MRLAQQFAIESDLVTADCIESTEFPQLAQRYQVYAVPKTVINGEASIDGSMPEGMFLDEILKAAGASNPDKS